MSIKFLLYLLAFLCEVAAALGVNSPRVNLMALGLALFLLTFLF